MQYTGSAARDRQLGGHRGVHTHICTNLHICPVALCNQRVTRPAGRTEQGRRPVRVYAVACHVVSMYERVLTELRVATD